MAPERWLVLTARVPADDPLRDLLIEGLLAMGGLSVLEEGDALTIYLDPPADPEAFVAESRSFLEEWIASDPPELSWRWQANEDWEREWRRGLQPRKVSHRFVVKPSWTDWSAGPGEVVIEIDPQMAFGTGEHATTRGCLRLLDESLRGGDRVLDIGSGSGILSIAAARAGAAEVIAVEYDPDANLNARENIDRNGAKDVIQLHEVLADPDMLRRLGRFDLILANILSSVICPLLPSLASSLKPDGRLIVSGILEREQDGVVEAAGAAGLVVRREDAEDEWWSAELGLESPASRV
ncbi:MAG: 50S ribosomal protein L11 methyltransferase [Gemmatimonadota bacterium]